MLSNQVFNKAGVKIFHKYFPDKAHWEMFFLYLFFLHYQFCTTCLYFAYNDHLSQHWSLKQRTWTHSCHSHVIAAKSCPQHRQRTKNHQWSENKWDWLDLTDLVSPINCVPSHLLDSDSLKTKQLLKTITKCPYLHCNRLNLHQAFLLFILVIKRSQKWLIILSKNTVLTLSEVDKRLQQYEQFKYSV